MRTRDIVGISLSGACLVHCLALPVLVSASPVLAWAEAEWVHVALALAALLVALAAMRRWPSGWLGAGLRGLALTGLTLLFYGALAEIGETFERWVTVIGALALSAAHALAWGASAGAHRHAGTADDF
ncbi:MerC domain-containing protein [Maricaulis sp.]|uniref:MerC domain-containing protein n=1 Tax=Maricaulis sp. TaxID=1486257 RepID=UPI0026180710|nr:MerC domain-containing protein [Maricaulis sp.]